jgi:hypothetical protein
MLKKKITKRKFYGKWLYKVTLNASGIGILRSKSPEETIFFLDNSASASEKKYHVTSTYSKAINNKDNISEICHFIKDINSTDWTKRIERNFLDFYTNDEKMYKDFCEKFSDILVHHFEPEADCIDLFTNQHVIIAKKYPHNKFKYKVYLKPHNLKKDIDSKKQFLEWIDSQKDKILISAVVKDWFIRTEWNWDRRYMLVDNEQTLLMLKMRSSDAIGKIYEYVISDK